MSQNPDAFAPGAMVLVTLGSPREKFWGALLNLSAAGLTVRGLDLTSLDDTISMVKTGEFVTPGAVFFPMHRVERMECDARQGGIASISERFAAQTGIDPHQLLNAAVPGGERLP